ncbi:MAG: cation:proton antiporter, partial [Bacteroides sp.]|nr:cation:proton antiporter [Bacteroides sp.]
GLLINPSELLDVALVGLLISLFMIFLGRPLSVMLCLLPFRKIPLKAKHFVSWVGLRGAVPIIFATYPVIAGVEGSNVIFNIVFFITLVSLIVQGSSIPYVAKFLKLSTPLEETGNTFGVELPDELETDLSDKLITADILKNGNTLKDMNLPQGTLVMMVKRGDQFLIPNGKLELQENDKLLLISEKREEPMTDSQLES